MTTIADALPLDASSGGRFENWSKTALSCETLIVLTRPCLLPRRQFIFATLTSCLDFIFLLIPVEYFFFDVRIKILSLCGKPINFRLENLAYDPE